MNVGHVRTNHANAKTTMDKRHTVQIHKAPRLFLRKVFSLTRIMFKAKVTPNKLKPAPKLKKRKISSTVGIIIETVRARIPQRLKMMISKGLLSFFFVVRSSSPRTLSLWLQGRLVCIFHRNRGVCFVSFSFVFDGAGA